MRITICGSIDFAQEMEAARERLEADGHEVLMPASIKDFGLTSPEKVRALKSDRKRFLGEIKPAYTKNHFNKIAESDAILVVNADKKGIKNYIGGATFAEIMLAFHYGKKIFLLNPVPRDEKMSAYVEEIEGCHPVILNGDFKLIK
jgi:hypothetical protein